MAVQASSFMREASSWWVAPVSAQAAIAFSRMRDKVAESRILRDKTSTYAAEGGQKIIFPNGATVWFKSGDNADSLYGEDVYGAVIDEASRMGGPSYHPAGARHHPGEHVHALRHQRREVPERVVRGRRLREAAVRLHLHGVDEVGELMASWIKNTGMLLPTRSKLPSSV